MYAPCVAPTIVGLSSPLENYEARKTSIHGNEWPQHGGSGIATDKYQIE